MVFSSPTMNAGTWWLLGSILLAPASAAAMQGTAGEPATSPNHGWTLEIVQDGEIIQARAGKVPEALINRSPFTIRVRLAELVEIDLNASDSDTILEQMRDGFSHEECDEDLPLFPCMGSGAAIDPGGTYLLIGDDLTLLLSHHEETWTRVEQEGEGWVLERMITDIGRDPIVFTGIPEIFLTLTLHLPDPAPHDVRFVRIRFR